MKLERFNNHSPGNQELHEFLDFLNSDIKIIEKIYFFLKNKCPETS